MSPNAEQRLERIQSRRARVGVIGLGCVGLPLDLEFARNGLTCTGIDLDRRTIGAATLAAVDCVTILTDHRAFDYDAIVAGAPVIVDTRHAITQRHPHVFTLGAVAGTGGSLAAGGRVCLIAVPR